MKITVMGCGNSTGTPSIGNYWGKCDPSEPKNRRNRPSLLIENENTVIVVDTGCDFREQMNRFCPPDKKLDAVLYTHAHSDHIGGIDELRVYRLRYKNNVPIYGNAETIQELSERFQYLFKQKASFYPEVLDPRVIRDEDMCTKHRIGDIAFIPFIQDHGTCRSLGFRFGDIGYSTDMLDLPEDSIRALQGVKIWIADGAGYHLQSPEVHANLQAVYALNEKICAEKVYITHLTPGMDYQTLCKELPAGFAPAYDGLQFKI